MTRRLAALVLAAGLLGGAAPVAQALTVSEASSRRVACVGHVDHGGYCLTNPVPGALELIDGVSP